MKEPHEVLGIPKDASKTAVKSAFRRLAQKWHPDKDKNNPVYHQKFQELNAAYASLMKSKSRQQFNRDDIRNMFRKIREKSSFPQQEIKKEQPIKNFGETFDQAKKQTHQKRKASLLHEASESTKNDIRYSVNITPADALNGTKKRIRLFNGNWVDVAIPPHTTNGQVLRLKGKGLLRGNNITRGDLLMVVKIDYPDIYRVEDNKVFVDIPITLEEAINGADVYIPTLAGTVLLSVPSEVNNGYTMRVKGKGMLLDEQTRGDLFAIVRIVMPPNFDERFCKMISEWNQRNPYDVREHFEHLI